MAYAGSFWKITTADGTIGASLTCNPPFDADSDVSVDANINKGSNLGASLNFIQILSINSPVRDLGSGGNPIFVSRAIRNSLMQIYYQQLTSASPYCLIYPRNPFTGTDAGYDINSGANTTSIPVFMHPLKLTRAIIGHGDEFDLKATFTYLSGARIT